MAITPDRVREIFRGLETGDAAAFFEHVADDVEHPPLGERSFQTARSVARSTIAGSEVNHEHCNYPLSHPP